MANLDPTNPEVIGLEQQKALAKALLEHGMEQNLKGQMVSGRYVRSSPWEGIAKLANIWAGKSMGEEAAQKEKTIAEGLREKGVNDIQDVMTLANGRAALPNEQLPGPAYNGVAPTIQYPEIKANPSAALAKALLSENPNVRSVAPVLAQTAFPKQTENMIEYDKYKSEGGKLGFNEWKNQLTPYQKAHLGILASNQAQSRVPMGYRMKQDGTLEAIPGGPADAKAQLVNVGRDTVDTLVTGLKDKYDLLKSSGGITSTSESPISNAMAAASSSGIGQALGRTFGTENQSERNKIAQSRPLLLQAIAKATGMSSKQMDSNTELKLYLDAATNPNLDYEANIYALDQLQNLYGIGGKAPVVGGNLSVPSAFDIDAEIARRQKGKK